MSSPTFSRPGAIDLSQLAAKAKSAGGAANPPAGQVGRGSGGSYVIEVTEQTFEAETIRRSTQYPVVLELYSPRVATGQQLSDTLAAIANASAGRFLLARINVDTAPGIVSALQLQAVPTVIALIGGQAAPLFQGVLPREQVEQALDQLLKAAVANGIVGRAQPVNGAEPEVDGEADEQGPDPRFAAADEALSRGDFAAAGAEFDRLLAANPNDAEAAAGKAQAGLFARATALDPETTLAAAASSSAVEAQLAAADVELVQGDVDAAFDRLIGVVRRGAGPDRDAARVRLLELFETVGPADARVVEARRDLMAALF